MPIVVVGEGIEGPIQHQKGLKRLTSHGDVAASADAQGQGSGLGAQEHQQEENEGSPRWWLMGSGRDCC